MQLREQGVTPEQVERIELRVHSLVLELTGKKEPEDGLQGKFSVYHGCAVGLIFGRAGEEEFSDAIVNRADVVALRRKVVATADSHRRGSGRRDRRATTAAACTSSSSTRSARWQPADRRPARSQVHRTERTRHRC